MNEEDRVGMERMLVALERIALALENMSPASSYAFMVSKAPEFMEQVMATAEKVKKQRTSSIKPVRRRIMKRRMAAVRRFKKD